MSLLKKLKKKKNNFWAILKDNSYIHVTQIDKKIKVMKKLLLLPLVSLLFSCQSQEEKMISIAENHIKESLLDPSSYKRTKISVVPDKVSDICQSSYYGDSLNLCSHNESYSLWSRLYNNYPSPKYLKEINRYNDSVSVYTEKCKNYKAKYNEVINTPKDTIVSYSVVSSYYGVRSSDGNKKIYVSHITLDKNNNIIDSYSTLL